MVSDIGRNVRPASSGEKPSTCWTYSVTRNHIEKAVAPRQKATTLAPDSARERKIRSGTSGAAARRPSTSRKSPRSAAPAAIGPSVAAAPHPWRSLLTMPYVTSTRPAVTLRAPRRSNERAAPGRRPSAGMTRSPTSTAPTATGALMSRIQRHDSVSVSRPPNSAPLAPPRPPIAPHSPSARLRSAPSA